jgi:hypothetical protein
MTQKADSMLLQGAAHPHLGRFALYHRYDRSFFALYVLLIWLGISMGFGPQIARHFAQNQPAYPLIVHVHAAAFVGWLVLLTTQVLLIRTRKLELHRTLGIAATVLAGAMIVLGPATALIVQHLQLGTSHSDPAFLSVQLCDILAFAVLIIPAFLYRSQPAVHKRLILLATLYISDAGFARWFGNMAEAAWGDGFWGQAGQLYLGNDLLILGLGAYDLITRRRLHPAYVAGTACIAAIQAMAIGLYLNPLWKPVALRLIALLN